MEFIVRQPSKSVSKGLHFKETVLDYGYLFYKQTFQTTMLYPTFCNKVGSNIHLSTVTYKIKAF